MTSKKPFTYSVAVKSTAEAGKEVCDKILSELRERGFSQEDIFAIHLALEEGFTNAVRHGNKMDAGKSILVDCHVDSKKVEITLTDEGEGFNPDDVPDPRTGDNLFKSSGRGLLLIRSYMDIAKYNKDGNKLYMVRNKRPRHEAAGNYKNCRKT
jgi:serine/threonine-protein kinase RsbW